jgi:hypothetical protein
MNSGIIDYEIMRLPRSNLFWEGCTRSVSLGLSWLEEASLITCTRAFSCYIQAILGG